MSYLVALLALVIFFILFMFGLIQWFDDVTKGIEWTTPEREEREP